MQGKDILCLPVETICPEVAAVKSINQLGSDAKFVFSLLNTAFHYILDSLFLSYLTDFDLLSSICGG